VGHVHIPPVFSATSCADLLVIILAHAPQSFTNCTTFTIAGRDTYAQPSRQTMRNTMNTIYSDFEDCRGSADGKPVEPHVSDLEAKSCAHTVLDTGLYIYL
jgi:hypothetical protein